MEEFVVSTLKYDFYGELLTPKQRQIYQSVVLEDYSVTEVANELGISRQGVFDMIKRCNKSLDKYEEKLHLVERFLTIKTQVKEIQNIASKYGADEIIEVTKVILEEL